MHFTCIFTYKKFFPIENRVLSENYQFLLQNEARENRVKTGMATAAYFEDINRSIQSSKTASDPILNFSGDFSVAEQYLLL